MTDIFVAANKHEKKTAKSKPQGHAHIFSSFCQNPVNVSFQEQEEAEEILLFLRRHLITNISWFFLTLAFASFPPILSVLNFKFQILNFLALPHRFIIIFILFYYLLVFSYAFVNFITWYFSTSLITNKRVIDINFSEIVYKNVSATKLSLVQDASYTQVGVIRSIFDYGDVLIQTAGTLDNFDFQAVPHPEKVVQIVENLIGKGPNAF